MHLQSALPEPNESIVVRDPAMLRLYEQATRAANAAISVLILGETGVGKELLVQSIHAQSARARESLLSLNCAGMSETILEGELFGYERGSFSGAHQARAGLFEAVDRGTVFLDEVGELTLSAQAKLLRVLENRTVLRLGARKETAVDVRFLAATNRDLTRAVENGTFRRDLLYRLNGFVLTVPPLRERRTEIEPIALHCLKRAFRELGRLETPHIESEALRSLREYSWPGNVRELRNAMERAAVLCTESTICRDHLPPEILSSARVPVVASFAAPCTPTGTDMPLKLAPDAAHVPPHASVLDEVRARTRTLERARIVEALARFDGNQTKAARALGLSRRTLVARLGQYDLPRPRKTKDEKPS